MAVLLILAFTLLVAVLAPIFGTSNVRAQVNADLDFSVVEQTVTTALSAGGCKNAVCRQLNPPQLLPIIPTAPLHQGWAASQAMMSQASCSSSAVYSSVISPWLSRSIRSASTRASIVASASRITGVACTAATRTVPKSMTAR